MQNKTMTQPAGEKQTAIEASIRTLCAIKADNIEELPSRIMLIRAGEWKESVKGPLSITVADLHQYKENFDKGLARPGQGIGLPIDFKHEEWDQAAGWIDGLIVEGDSLYADPVSWSTAGKEAILGGMFKCISPSFYPAGRGGWTDPENLKTAIENVIVGAGLTNIPFFKDLSPVRASSLPENGNDDNIIYVSKSASAKEKEDMSIDEIRVKDPTALTADEKAFVADNKALLSADEQAKFGLVEADTSKTDIKDNNEKKVDASMFSQDEQKIIADIRSGSVKVVASTETVVEKETLAKLEASATQYQTEKAESIVTAHVARGALKSDQAEYWTNQLLASEGEKRTAFETALAALPSNELLKEEVGNDNAGNVAATAREEMDRLAQEKIVASAKDGKVLNYADALKQVANENANLNTQDRVESGIGA
jgi:hypothetical protein